MIGKRWNSFTPILVMFFLATPGEARPKKAPQWKACSDRILECAGALDASCIEEWEGKLSALGAQADPGVRALLTSDNEVAVAAGLRVLQAIGGQPTADFAAGLLVQDDFDFKAQVAEGIGAFKGKIVVDALAGLTSSRRPFEREKAVEALGRVGDPSGIDALVVAAKDKFFSVRIKACEAMGRFDDKRVLEALGAALASDGNSGVRVAGARALGETKARAAVPLLIVGLEDSSFTVQTAAYEALKSITKVDLGAAPDDWRSWLKRSNKK
ncbi:MAG: HEAT repeat domain-containing protein [Pseudomonadota bacterium]